MSKRIVANKDLLDLLRPLIFQGYPYLITVIVPALYHIILLPSYVLESELLKMAAYQVHWNRLKTCLVLGDRRFFYFDMDRSYVLNDSPPYSSHVVVEKIVPGFTFKLDDDYRGREAELRSYVDSRCREGFLLGDLTKGARLPTKEELAKLMGKSREGVPLGLSRCPKCREWAGECIDPDPAFANQVMRVFCRCQNDNRCAWCHELLCDRKLNANYYNESDGRIWHAPAFSALSHICPGGK
jgi:hypothetical protein